MATPVDGSSAAGLGVLPVYHVVYNSSSNSTVLVCDTSGGGGMVILGIAIGLLSSIAINVGQNLQSIGGKMVGADKDPCSSKTWVIGLTIFAVGALGNMLAMAFASATILVPLESSQFVTNILFSKFVNKVAVTSRQMLGTTLAVVGTTLICAFGPNDQRCFTIDDFRLFWQSPLWIGWVVGTFALSAIGWIFYARLLATSTKQTSSGGTPPPWAESSLAALFALSSALVGGAQMIVHTKALAELLDMMFAGQFSVLALLSDWIFWVEFLLTATCGFFWLRQMGVSIMLYDPLFIIPLLQSSYITFGCAASGIFYQEFHTMSEGVAGEGTYVIFIGGVLMIVVGILLLAPPSSFTGCARSSSKAAKPILKGIPGHVDMADLDHRATLDSGSGSEASLSNPKMHTNRI